MLVVMSSKESFAIIFADAVSIASDFAFDISALTSSLLALLLLRSAISLLNFLYEPSAFETYPSGFARSTTGILIVRIVVTSFSSIEHTHTFPLPALSRNSSGITTVNDEPFNVPVAILAILE